MIGFDPLPVLKNEMTLLAIEVIEIPFFVFIYHIRLVHIGAGG